MKDDTCIIRQYIVTGETVDVPGFVRVLDATAVDERVYLIVLCDADPIVWRLRFEVVTVDGPAVPCLTGLTYVGRWLDRWLGAVVFMHPPARALDEPWAPGRADMTLVEPERK